MSGAARPLRVLVTAYDFRPRLGGVATCAYEVTRALARVPEVRVRVLARAQPGDRAFDGQSGLETRRIALADLSPLATAQLAAALSRELIAFRPQAVLNFLWLPCGAASLACAPIRRARSVPYYVFVHGNELLETDRTLYKRARAALAGVKKQVLGQAGAVFAVSRYTAGLATNLCGVAPGRVVVTFNGVDGSAFTPGPGDDSLARRYGIEGRRVFLSVTRLEDYKGVDRAIAALARVVEKFPNVVYLVAGEGPDRARLEALARYYRVSGHVVFAGALAPGELAAHYRLADALVLLSRLDAEAPNVEGFGIVILEAAACGRPAIGGRSGGIVDAIEEGKSGWLVDPWDDQAIARAMLECLREPGRASEMGRYARERAMAAFGWDRVAFKVLERIRADVRDRGSGAALG